MKTPCLPVWVLAAACALSACNAPRQRQVSTTGGYSGPQFQGPYYGTSYYRYGPPYTNRSFHASGPVYVGPVYYYNSISSRPPSPTGRPQRVTTWQYTSRDPRTWGAPVLVYRSESDNPRLEPRTSR